MATLPDLMLRAQQLRQETAVDSISPERAGGIMYDTLAYINQMQLQGENPLLISKIYASVAAMEADSAPVSDLNGQPLRPGQVVVIATGDPDDPDEGVVYRYDGTEGGVSSWSVAGKIGNVDPVDSLDSDSTTLPLAAHQGKVLDGKISQLGQYVDNAEYIWAIVDSEGKLLIGLRVDGSFEYAKGLPTPLAGIIQQLEQSKVDSIPGYQLVLSQFVQERTDEEYIYAMTDAEGKVLFGIRKDGTLYYNARSNNGEKSVEDYTIPEKIFEVINDIPYYQHGGTLDNKEFSREYLNTLYADRLYVGGKCPFLDGVGQKVLSTPIRWRQSIVGKNTETNFNLVVGGNGFKSFNVPFSLISSKASSAIGENITLMAIGDSITQSFNAGFWDKSGDWSYADFVAELFEMDDIDNQEDNEAAAGAIKFHLIGTRKQAERVVSYRGHTIDHSDDCTEGRGGWSACNYLRHPFDLEPNTGDYDILGLRTAHGDPSNFPDYVVYQLIANTCWGLYPPDITENSWNRFRSRIGYGNVSWADATAAQKQELYVWATETIVDNPINPFYSKDDYDANTNTMFSWDAYYARYKTYENDATTPLVNKGTNYIDGTIVCVPQYISIALGANDGKYMQPQSAIAEDIMTMANLLKTATNAKILLITTAWPASQIPMFHPNLSQIEDDYSLNNLRLPYLRNKKLISLAGVFSEQVSNGIIICPSFFVQGYDTSRTHKNESLGTDFDYDYSWDTEDVHPGPGGHKQIAYQLYSLIMYFLSLN